LGRPGQLHWALPGIPARGLAARRGGDVMWGRRFGRGPRSMVFGRRQTESPTDDWSSIS
jgi:hypothetical protein